MPDSNNIKQCVSKTLERYFRIPTVVQDLLIMIDTTVQFGEDEDVKTRDFEYPDKDDDDE